MGADGSTRCMACQPARPTRRTAARATAKANSWQRHDEDDGTTVTADRMHAIRSHVVAPEAACFLPWKAVVILYPRGDHRVPIRQRPALLAIIDRLSAAPSRRPDRAVADHRAQARISMVQWHGDQQRPAPGKTGDPVLAPRPLATMAPAAPRRKRLEPECGDQDVAATGASAAAARPGPGGGTMCGQHLRGGAHDDLDEKEPGRLHPDQHRDRGHGVRHPRRRHRAAAGAAKEHQERAHGDGDDDGDCRRRAAVPPPRLPRCRSRRPRGVRHAR